MKLSPEQICQITQGALRTEVVNGTVSFHRFTKEQEALYACVSADFSRKTQATAGVRLELRTDAEQLTLSYRAKAASSRRFCYLDVLVDGKLLAHHGHEDVQEVSDTLTLTLPEGTHTVSIYLPCLFAASITCLSLNDGATLCPVKRPVRMIAFGDSITQGYDARYPSRTYVNRLADALNAEVTDLAIGGEIFRPALITKDLQLAPDLITVAYGTNDWAHRTEQELRDNSLAFYTRLRAAFPQAKIFALTPIWRADAERKTACGCFESAREAVRAAARAQRDITVIEGDPLVPHDPALYDDLYLHPNDAGFTFYAENLLSHFTHTSEQK